MNAGRTPPAGDRWRPRLGGARIARPRARLRVSRPARLAGDPTGRVGPHGSCVFQRRPTRATSRTVGTGRSRRAGTRNSVLRLTPAGCCAWGATVTNVGDSPYTLDALASRSPLPAHAAELSARSTAGGAGSSSRTADCSAPVRCDVENRRGRTSHEHPPLVFAGSGGFGEHAARCGASHVAWSGNRRCSSSGSPTAAVSPVGRTAPPRRGGARARARRTRRRRCSACTPPRADGAQPGVPPPRARPSPAARRRRGRCCSTSGRRCTSITTTTGCARSPTAASVGVERFVVDDGWFGGRRDDQRRLGDWWVSPDVYPDGL